MRLIICCCLMLLTQNMFAEPDWIYEVEVNDISKESFAALQQVVDRLTPGHNDHDNPIIKQVNPKQFIQSIKHPKTQQTVLRFEPQSIQELMTKAGLRPWLNRPSLPTFVLLLDHSVYRCILPRHDPALFEGIERSAKTKGLTLTFICPEDESKRYDLHDQPWEPEFIAKEAKLDSPDGVLILKIHRRRKRVMEAGRMLFQGQFSNDSMWFDFLNEKPFLPSLTYISQFLFNTLDHNPPEASPIDIRFHNIHNGKDFEKVKTHLNSIHGIVKISLNSVTADSVLYTLNSTISRELLAMRLDNTYQSMPLKTGENILNYRLIA